MKSKFSVTIWAAVAAVLLPLASMSQVAKPSGKADSADTAETPTKYEVFLGYGYTSLNQVPGSRYGLMGVTVSGTRDWGKYFGVTVDAGSYGHATNTGNPGHFTSLVHESAAATVLVPPRATPITLTLP